MFDFKFLSERIDYKGKQIQTYEYGNGEIPILALPSYPNTGLYYLFVSKYYPNGNYKIISFDLPGWMGWSENIWENQTYDSNKYVEIAEAVLKAKKIKNFSLLGYSLSGSIALRLAAKNKERINKMVIMSPVIYKDLLRGEKMLKLIKLGKTLNASWAFMNYLNKTIARYKDGTKNNLDQTVFELYSSAVINVNPKILVDSLYEAFTTDYSSFVKELKDINHKMLVVNFRSEPKLFKMQARKLVEDIGGDCKLEVEGGHHEDFVLHPSAEKAKQVLGFLTNL